MREKAKEKKKDTNRLNELEKILNLIETEKSKIKICLLCKKKFANIMHF
jgi:hypothetical protein